MSIQCTLIPLQTRSIDVSVKTEENDVVLSQASRSPFQLLIYLTIGFSPTTSYWVRKFAMYGIYLSPSIQQVVVVVTVKLDKYDARSKPIVSEIQFKSRAAFSFLLANRPRPSVDFPIFVNWDSALPSTHYVTTDEMSRNRATRICKYPDVAARPAHADWIITRTTSPTYIYILTSYRAIASRNTRR